MTRHVQEIYDLFVMRKSWNKNAVYRKVKSDTVTNTVTVCSYKYKHNTVTNKKLKPDSHHFKGQGTTNIEIFSISLHCSFSNLCYSNF